jgi:hypothetical protein
MLILHTAIEKVGDMLSGDGFLMGWVVCMLMWKTKAIV